MNKYLKNWTCGPFFLPAFCLLHWSSLPWSKASKWALQKTSNWYLMLHWRMRNHNLIYCSKMHRLFMNTSFGWILLAGFTVSSWKIILVNHLCFPSFFWSFVVADCWWQFNWTLMIFSNRTCTGQFSSLPCPSFYFTSLNVIPNAVSNQQYWKLQTNNINSNTLLIGGYYGLVSDLDGLDSSWKRGISCSRKKTCHIKLQLLVTKIEHLYNLRSINMLKAYLTKNEWSR